jgi:hypothetical protein
MKESQIGVLNEKHLHASLKSWYAQPGDRFEVLVDGFLVDIVRDDLLIEVQTKNFAAIKRKLKGLVSDHPVRLVYPVIRQKWIVRLDGDGAWLSRRKSPRSGMLTDVFQELVSFPELVRHPNFSLEILSIDEEEVRYRHENRRWWRRGWAIQERRLLDVVGQNLIETPDDIIALMPPGLTEPFTTADLAEAIGRPRRLAQKMTYCLRAIGCIAVVGKQGNTVLYTRISV